MKNLTDIMDRLAPEELEKLLEEDELAADISEEKTDRITKKTLEKTGLTGKSAKKFRTLILAAAAVLLLAAAGGFFAVRAEAKEYEAAVNFFRENDLDPEGLTREEMKKVYRDISMKSFVEEKSREILKKSLEGVLIEQEFETPEEMKKVWSWRVHQYEAEKQDAQNPRSFRLREEFKEDPGLGFEVFDRSILEVYERGELKSSTAFTDFWAAGCVPVSDGVIVYGNTYRWDGRQPSPAWIMKADTKGNILWTRMLDHQFSLENVGAILEESDGSLDVFSIGDYRELQFSRFSSEGEEIQTQKKRLGEYTYWISDAARYGDGFLLTVSSNTEGQYARVIRMSPDGNVAGDISYDAGDQLCVIRDKIAFSGKVYISAYLVPAYKNAPVYGPQYEVMPIIEKVMAGSVSAIDLIDHLRVENGEITQEEYDAVKDELTPLIRENYTGILLVCDPMSGEPESFFEVPGVLGSSLSINEYGQMEWNTESFLWTKTTLALNSSMVVGECSVYRYTFDTDGSLICGEQTDETVEFRR